MLDLALLGLLKEQPLHGYELKKRLGETLGFLWGVSYGSLYPALARLERSGAIEIVVPGPTSPDGPRIPSTGSVKGELATARGRLRPKVTRRTRKQYRLTERGNELFATLLAADDSPGTDEEKAFALRFAFCRHLSSSERIALLERRRNVLSTRLDRARSSGLRRSDRYTLSLMEHRTRSTERDLEWIEGLIASEREQLASEPTDPPIPEGATSS